jgi:hypothetical protein
MEVLASINEDNPDLLTDCFVSNRRSGMPRSGKRWPRLHFEISNTLTTVNQVRETAHGLSLPVAFSGWDRPSKL